MAIDGEPRRVLVVFRSPPTLIALASRDGSVPANLETGRGSMATPRARSVPA
jgi:hypothetical protein